MIHELHLNDASFHAIKSRTKTIEMRLYDEKRSKYKIGDTLIFTNRTTGELLKTIITNLYQYNNFVELYSHFDKLSLGYTPDEIAHPSDMEAYYPIEEQQQYGVLAIEIKLYD